MGTFLSVNKRYMVIEAEGVAGTAEVPLTGDHIVRFRDINITPTIEMDDENSKYANATHTEDEAIAGNQMVQITASCKVTYSGTPTTDPDWFLPAKACGVNAIGWTAGAEAAYPGTVGLGLVSRAIYDDQTYTIWIIDESIGASPTSTIYKASGCMGNMVLSCEGTGKPVMAQFTFSGKLVDIVDGSSIAINAATQTTLAPGFASSAFTIGGVATAIDGWQFDMGNVIEPVKSQADATGISHYVRTSTRPRFSCGPLAVKQATTDILNLVMTEASVPIDIPIGSNMQLNLTDVQYMSPGLAVREGLVAWEHTFRCLANGVPGTPADAALGLEDTWELTHGART